MIFATGALNHTGVIILTMTMRALSLLLPLFALAADSQKYVSPDRSFQFVYPSGYVLHAGTPESYIPVCHSDSLVCVIFPADKYKGTTFGAASFEVKPVAADTQRACLNSEIFTKDPGRVIDGVKLSQTVEEDAAMSHRIESNLYRGFKKGKCYELAVRVTYTDIGVYDPGTVKEFTAQDKNQVVRELTRIMESLKFLR